MKLEDSNIMNRKCVLWGKKRHIYEFFYMFDFLDYLGYFSVDENFQYEVSLRKLSSNDFGEIAKENPLFIICDLHMDESVAFLQENDQKAAFDYICFEDCFCLLDKFTNSILGGRKIAIWGIGETEKNLRIALAENHYNIHADIYIDRNAEENDLYRGCPVKRLMQINNIEQYFVIVASIYYRDIKKELNRLGLIEGKDYLPFSCFMSRPSKMMKELVHTSEMPYFYCNRPYTWFYYAWFGAYSCCSTWVKYPIGNPAADSPQECWNSTVAKLYRLSVDTKTYCFCKKDACGLMGNTELQIDKPDDYAIPQKITLGLDYTCNLHCASCRENVQIATGEQMRIRECFAEEMIQSGWLENTCELELSGSGEALFSKIDTNIIFSDARCRREAISLMSNGILLNQENLQRLIRHYKKVYLKISLDAASEETYGKLRRGGNWKTLLKNLEIIRNMRQDNKLEYVEIRMVVQKSNYKEMIDFIQMGKTYLVDKVVFTKLLNWDMYSEERYLEEAMLNHDGSLQTELMNILRKEEMHDEIVQMTEFSRYLRDFEKE